MSELIVIDYIHCISGEFLRIGKIGRKVGNHQTTSSPDLPHSNRQNSYYLPVLSIYLLKKE